MAKAVVAAALVLVAQDFVGLGRLLELLLGVGIVAVDVGMELARKASERLLDLPLVGCAGDADCLLFCAKRTIVTPGSIGSKIGNKDIGLQKRIESLDATKALK